MYLWFISVLRVWVMLPSKCWARLKLLQTMIMKIKAAPLQTVTKSLFCLLCLKLRGLICTTGGGANGINQVRLYFLNLWPKLGFYLPNWPAKNKGAISPYFAPWEIFISTDNFNSISNKFYFFFKSYQQNKLNLEFEMCTVLFFCALP